MHRITIRVDTYCPMGLTVPHYAWCSVSFGQALWFPRKAFITACAIKHIDTRKMAPTLQTEWSNWYSISSGNGLVTHKPQTVPWTNDKPGHLISLSEMTCGCLRNLLPFHKLNPPSCKAYLAGQLIGSNGARKMREWFVATVLQRHLKELTLRQDEVGSNHAL